MTPRGYFYITIISGEPLLNNDIFNIASYAKNKNIYCTINTNGSLINESNISKMVVFDSVKFSLDSLNEEINDRIRSKGCLRGVMKAIDLLNSKNIPVYIGTVVSKYTINY